MVYHGVIEIKAETIERYITMNPDEFPGVVRARVCYEPGENIMLEIKGGARVKFNVPHIHDTMNGRIGKFIWMLRYLPSDDTRHYDLTYFHGPALKMLLNLYDEYNRLRKEHSDLRDQVDAIDTTKDTLDKFAGEFTKAMKEAQ